MPHSFSRSLSVGLDLWEGLLDELSKDCGRKEGHIAFLLAHLQVQLEQTALAQRAVLVAAQVEVLFEPKILSLFKKIWMWQKINNKYIHTYNRS